MKKLTTLQVIVIIVLAAIVLFLPLIWKGGPSGREVNAALKLRWAQVEGQRINYMSRHNPRASLAHGPVDIKIKNKYTREQNGVTYYFYEFSMTTTFGENKDREAEIDSGTIVFEKQGKQWRYFYL
jgi:hypothetical protein